MTLFNGRDARKNSDRWEIFNRLLLFLSKLVLSIAVLWQKNCQWCNDPLFQDRRRDSVAIVTRSAKVVPHAVCRFTEHIRNTFTMTFRRSHYSVFIQNLVKPVADAASVAQIPFQLPHVGFCLNPMTNTVFDLWNSFIAAWGGGGGVKPYRDGW